MMKGAKTHPDAHLERQPCLHLSRQHLRDRAIKAAEHLHRELRLHAPIVHKDVEGVDDGEADAAHIP